MQAISWERFIVCNLTVDLFYWNMIVSTLCLVKHPGQNNIKTLWEKRFEQSVTNKLIPTKIKLFLPRSDKQEVFKLHKLWISVWSLCIQEFRDCTNILLIITHPNNSLTSLWHMANTRLHMGTHLCSMNRNVQRQQHIKIWHTYA